VRERDKTRDKEKESGMHSQKVSEVDFCCNCQVGAREERETATDTSTHKAAEKRAFPSRTTHSQLAGRVQPPSSPYLAAGWPEASARWLKQPIAALKSRLRPHLSPLLVKAPDRIGISVGNNSWHDCHVAL
jgi:hypothetical protein